MIDPDLELAWSGIDLEDEEQVAKIEQIEVTTWGRPTKSVSAGGKRNFRRT